MCARAKYFIASFSGRELRTVPAIPGVYPRCDRRKLLLEPTASAVPVLLRADRIGRHPEAGELRPLPQAALEFGEPAELGEPDDVIPQPAGVLDARQPADHRSEERRAVRWVEMQ